MQYVITWQILTFITGNSMVVRSKLACSRQQASCFFIGRASSFDSRHASYEDAYGFTCMMQHCRQCPPVLPFSSSSSSCSGKCSVNTCISAVTFLSLLNYTMLNVLKAQLSCYSSQGIPYGFYSVLNLSIMQFSTCGANRHGLINWIITAAAAITVLHTCACVSGNVTRLLNYSTHTQTLKLITL